MPKTVHIQLRGREKTVEMTGDKVDHRLIQGTMVKILTISLGDVPVGEFKDDSVDGWWIEEQSPKERT
jgi:hypothetical protein